MAAKTSNEIEFSQRLGRLLKSPVRVEIMVLLLERATSPKEISAKFGLTLSTASHHVQELLKMELIELVSEEPRRGATEHFYRAVLRPIWSDEDWGKLSREERQEYATWLMQLVNCDVAVALAAQTFHAQVETHASRSAFCVDEQGRQELNEIQNEALKASIDVEAASTLRLAKKRAEGSHLMTVMLCIDMPAPKRHPHP